jgi:DNA-binding transcriptional MerR regulator
MNTQAAQPHFRIGEVAERAGVTTRTIRYYEELGLLGCSGDRAKGAHRLYTEANVGRLQELIRLRDLLGLSLDELVELAEAEEARAVLRNRWEEDPDDDERLRLLKTAIPLVERQLSLVRTRQRTLMQFANELDEKLGIMNDLWRELGGPPRATRR